MTCVQTAQAGMLPGDVVVVCSRIVHLSEVRYEKDGEMTSHHHRHHHHHHHQKLQQHHILLCRNGFLVSNKLQH